MEAWYWYSSSHIWYFPKYIRLTSKMCVFYRHTVCVPIDALKCQKIAWMLLESNNVSNSQWSIYNCLKLIWEFLKFEENFKVSFIVIYLFSYSLSTQDFLWLFTSLLSTPMRKWRVNAQSMRINWVLPMKPDSFSSRKFIWSLFFLSGIWTIVI